MLTKSFNAIRSFITNKKIIYFEHTKQTYAISDIPSLNYNTWYNFTYIPKHTKSEQKEIYKIINLVININVLSELICEYVNENYEMKLYIRCVDEFETNEFYTNEIIFFLNKNQKQCDLLSTEQVEVLVELVYKQLQNNTLSSILISNTYFLEINCDSLLLRDFLYMFISSEINDYLNFIKNDSQYYCEDKSKLQEFIYDISETINKKLK